MKILALALLVSTGCSGGVATFVVVHDTGDAGPGQALAEEHQDAGVDAREEDAVPADHPGEDAQAPAPGAPYELPDGAITVAPTPDASPDHSGMVQACCPQTSTWGCQYIVIGGSSNVDVAIASGSCEWVKHDGAGQVYSNPDPSVCSGPCTGGMACTRSDGSCGCSSLGTGCR